MGIVTVEEAKNYLRLDNDCDDELVAAMIEAAEVLCLDVARCEREEFEAADISKAAMLYTIGYFYEHRENGDHHGLLLTLRSLLFSLREGVF